MPHARLAATTFLTLLAFAGNSLLCRAALGNPGADPAAFTLVRLTSGALMLSFLVYRQGASPFSSGKWVSALALFAYAAGFSFAYLKLSAATGALLLFAAVQTTMIGYGFWKGERLRAVQIFGLLLACIGLIWLLYPGISSPPLDSALLMLGAGIAWGIYSILGKGVSSPVGMTAGNFLRSLPFALGLILLTSHPQAINASEFWLAVCSGALASGIGYAMWYSVLPFLKSTVAATLQLSVPIIATIGGIFLLGESISFRLLVASGAVLGGIALVVFEKRI